MTPGVNVLHRISLSILMVSLLSACSMTPYRYEPLEDFNIVGRAESQEQGDFKVRASVPNDEEAKALFGIDLTRRNIQAVWLEITNNRDQRARFAPYSVDAGYFPPHEVAYMYRKQFSKEGWQDMERRFYEMSMPRFIAPGETVSGFVFTNANPGTKTFNVDIFYASDTAQNEHFTFFLDVPGFTPDYHEVEFDKLYQPDEIRDVDLEGLRALVADLPCCTSNIDGDGQGMPVNTLLVAPGRELLQALLRAGWNETAYEKSDNYLNSTDYFFGRPPDAIFRKSLGRGRERNEMGVWLAPIRVDGAPAWVIQNKHALGRVFELGEMFLGVPLDPDVDDGRNYLLQDFWYSQSLEAFGWSKSGIEVSRENPTMDFNNNPFFADGYRLVMWLSGETVSLMDARNVGWDALPGF